jgi:hypothetical protein
MKVEKEKGIHLGNILYKKKEIKMDIYFLYFARKKKNKMNNIFFCKRNQKYEK